MIRRLLVANRGEIAVRIVRACRELGIESVAVYSGADARAPHVLAADRAIALGSSVADSYLSIEGILEAARASSADAVHPGYGFLSESPRFAAECEAAGLVFVGPTSDVISRMGTKIESRALMAEAGIPIVPGETPTDQSDEGVAKAIARIGLPALIKASAGGGGKGMRLAHDAGEVLALAQAARREALAAFGDGTLYVERLLERPRHVEVQVFGDRAGNVVHLFERECSVQRRHQKVIEESPSPAISPALRRRMTEAAIRAARAVSYLNAGTVEFLVDAQAGSSGEAPFYFLEMNTRLQVEHPVTELVAGVDLVHAQLHVAAGGPLPWQQEELSQRGHAIEARVYAEDPAAGYLPQAGRLALYREPRMPGVRVDSGVAEGDEIGVHYDPLLAKVIAHAETREGAARRLAAALRAFPVLGIRTNIAFLVRVLEDRHFREAAVHTTFLDAEGAVLAEEPSAGAVPPVVAQAWAAHGEGELLRNASSAWDPWGIPIRAASRVGEGVYRIETGDRAEVVYVAGPPYDRWAFWNGRVYRGGADQTGAAPRRRPHRGDGGEALTAPMPATVTRVLVQPGDAVRKGDTVVILEAMKMELPVRAAGDAVVDAVRCREGELVAADAVLVTLR
jgi:acetyl/propionyl-CoA carboxylase alpha subunit